MLKRCSVLTVTITTDVRLDFVPTLFVLGEGVDSNKAKSVIVFPCHCGILLAFMLTEPADRSLTAIIQS